MCVPGHWCVSTASAGVPLLLSTLLITSAHCSDPPAGGKCELYAAAARLDLQGQRATAKVGWQLPAALPAVLASLP